MTVGFYQRLGLVSPARLLLVLVILGLVGGGPTVVAQGTEIDVHSASKFWIQGEATTHTFTCVVERVEGEATLPSSQEALSSAQGSSATRNDRQPEVLVRVPVEAFDCGKRMMTKDLQETLRMEEHPTIRLELVHATVGDPVPEDPKWRRVEVLGTLTIAGKKRLRRIHLAGRAFGDDRFRIRGCHPIRMTYFGIEPPTKAFGLIKVKNRVEVQFDLLAHAERVAPDSAFAQVPADDRPRPSCEGQGD